MACNLLSGCNNKVFKNLNYCALHCEKNSHKIDAESGLLTEFNNMLNRHIIDDVLSKKNLGMQEPYFINQLNECKKNNTPIHKINKCRSNLSNRTLWLDYIKFPVGNLTDYLENLKVFKSVRFFECSFSSSEFDLELTPVYFKSCSFKNDFQIKKTVLYKIEEDCVFYECTFEHKVYIDLKDEIKEDRIFEYTLFEECCFRSVVSLRYVEFQKELFKFKPISKTDSELSKRTWLSSILINNVVFHDKCKFNYIDIVNLVIKDTKFLSKLEVKESFISYFELNNSNVSEVFDSFDSRFIRFIFYKSIFTDFSGFEKVRFGLEDNFNDLYTARFIYTTFMNFSNFRSTKFLSGLDFENSNLKEQPNFLKTYISPTNTNRETFRIIKNSFEKSNNKIESNKFFVYEMKEYRRKAKYTEGFSTRFVLCANYYISRFGESYIQPFIIFLLSIGIYTYILELHKNIFSGQPIVRYVVSLRNFVIQDWFVSLSKFLNACAANVPLFSKALESKSGIEFISLLFFIWFGILTWQIIVSVKRNTQH